MSVRKKSLPRQKNLIDSPRQHYSTLKNSLKNVTPKQYETKLRNLHSTKNLKSQISPRRRIEKTAATKSHASPFRATLKKDYVYEDYSKSSDTSIETFGKFSSEESMNSSQEYKLESPLLVSIKNTFPDTIEYENELVMHRQENKKRKSKIKELQEKPPRLVKKEKEKEGEKQSEKEREKGKSVAGSERELRNELQRQKEMMEREHKQALERQKSELLEEYQREFELIQDHLLNKLKSQQKKMFAAKEKEQQEFSRREKQSLEKEHEHRLKKKISEIAGEYEKQLEKAEDEASWLRKQNDKLKRELQDHTDRTGIASHKHEFISNSTIDLNRQYNEICKSYNQLQHDYFELKKQKTSNLCSKCKAFTEANEELSNKITRIRAYIESKN